MGKPILATFAGRPDELEPWKKGLKLPAVSWEVITPEIAHMYLEKNFDNRRKRPSTVAFYASAMKKNQWYITHQAIAFDENGNIIDGQHRLDSVIRSGIPVLFLVVRGVPSETKRVCDQMLKRGGDDALRWAGESYKGSAPSANLRRMMLGMAWDYKIGNPDLIAFSQEYHEHMQFAMDCFPSNAAYVTQAAVKAVFARAHFCGLAKKTLQEFANVLYSGISDANSVIRFRDFLRNSPGVRASVSIREVYAKCEQALDLFAKDQPLKGKLCGATEEMYPIPWDKVSKERMDETQAAEPEQIIDGARIETNPLSVEDADGKLQLPISVLELSVRSENCLVIANIGTLGDLVKMSEHGLLKLKNFGETSLKEVRKKVHDMGLALAG